MLIIFLSVIRKLIKCFALSTLCELCVNLWQRKAEKKRKSKNCVENRFFFLLLWILIDGTIITPAALVHWIIAHYQIILLHKLINVDILRSLAQDNNGWRLCNFFHLCLVLKRSNILIILCCALSIWALRFDLLGLYISFAI